MTLLIVLTALAWVAAALSAGACYSSFRQGQQMHSLRSLQDAILDAVDCASKASAAVKRIEGRQTATMRPSSATETLTLAPEILDKAALRAKYAAVLQGPGVKRA